MTRAMGGQDTDGDGILPREAPARGLAGLVGGLRDVLVGVRAPVRRPGGPTGEGRESAEVVVVPGPEEMRKQQVNGRLRWYAGALVGLSYLVIAMVQAATSGGSVGDIVVFEVLAVCFGAVYFLAPVRVAGGGAFVGVTGGAVSKAASLLLMLAISVPMIVVGGVGITSLWIYIGVVAAVMFPLPVALACAVALAGAMVVVSAVAGEPLPWELALTLVAVSLWMGGFVGNIRLTTELRATREELARAAVAAERARIGRDLHDILGHSLTAIAVKAGLARRLVGRDVEAAVTEIADVERLAREALSDVRATAAGYRDVSLAAELAVARSVLQAAGIRPELPTAVDDVTAAGRDLFGYVVREAVTNVVRHARATCCIVELTPTSVQITDDGAGGLAGTAPGVGGAAAGNGLRGLADRVAAAGGRLSAGPVAGGGFRVRAEVHVNASVVGGQADGEPGEVAVAHPGDDGRAGSRVVGGAR